MAEASCELSVHVRSGAGGACAAALLSVLRCVCVCACACVRVPVTLVRADDLSLPDALRAIELCAAVDTITVHDDALSEEDLQRLLRVSVGSSVRSLTFFDSTYRNRSVCQISRCQV